MNNESRLLDEKFSILTSIIQVIQQEPTVSFLAGGIAGALARTAVSPMERVKVLYQVQDSESKTSYKKGTLRTIHQIWLEEGYKGLFRGNGINCLRIFPYSAIQYSAYQELKIYLKNPITNELSTGNKLIAGSIAGFLSVLFTYPMDLVKTRLSIQTSKSLSNLHTIANSSTNEKPPGVFQSIKTIYKSEGGLKALYRGIVPTSLGVAPYVALNFTIFENLKESYTFYFEEKPNSLSTLVFGGLSGCIGQTLIYPMDILRRRFQVATLAKNIDGAGRSSKKRGTGVVCALVNIVKQEGYRGLFRGWGANMWKITPSMAVQWASYDLIKQFILAV